MEFLYALMVAFLMEYSNLELYSEHLKRTKNWLSGYDNYKSDFLDIVEKKFGIKVRKICTHNIELFLNLSFQDQNHKNVKAYLSHPLRVTSSLIKHCKEFTKDQVNLGIFHNLFEIFEVSDEEALSILGNYKNIETIKLLLFANNKSQDT